MSTIVPRDTRNQIAAMTYDGIESLADAATLQRKMAAAVEVAKRARVDAREHLWLARESERALGRMILAARAAGDLADRGGDRRSNQVPPGLKELGIAEDLAAYAVRLAEVSDDVWNVWHEQDVEPTQRAVDAAARKHGDRVEELNHRVTNARADLDQAQKDIDERLAEVERLAAEAREYVERVAAPPLLHDEVDTSAAEFVLPATAAEPRAERDPNADEWTALFRRLAAFNQALQGGPSRLPSDFQADITVLAARDLAAAATANVAVWIRHVNDLYSLMTQEGQK